MPLAAAAAAPVVVVTAAAADSGTGLLVSAAGGVVPHEAALIPETAYAGFVSVETALKAVETVAAAAGTCVPSVVVAAAPAVSSFTENTSNQSYHSRFKNTNATAEHQTVT